MPRTLLGKGLVPDPAQATSPALQLATLRGLQTQLEAKSFDAGHIYSLRAVCGVGKRQRGFAALRALDPALNPEAYRAFGQGPHGAVQANAIAAVPLLQSHHVGRAFAPRRKQCRSKKPTTLAELLRRAETHFFVASGTAATGLWPFRRRADRPARFR